MQGCTNRHIDEAVLEEAFLMAWNLLILNREEFKKKWERIAEFGNPLEQYRAIQFADMIEGTEQIKDVDRDFIFKTLDQIKVFESGKVMVRFMDGMETECGSK